MNFSGSFQIESNEALREISSKFLKHFAANPRRDFEFNWDNGDYVKLSGVLIENGPLQPTEDGEGVEKPMQITDIEIIERGNRFDRQESD